MKKIITLGLISVLAGCSVVRQINEAPHCQTQAIDSTKQKLAFLLSVSPSRCFDSANANLTQQNYLTARNQPLDSNCHNNQALTLTAHDQQILANGFIDQIKPLAQLYQTQYQTLLRQEGDCNLYHTMTYQKMYDQIPAILKAIDTLEQQERLPKVKRASLAERKQAMIAQQAHQEKLAIAARQQYYQSLPALKKTHGALLFQIMDVELNHRVDSPHSTNTSIETVIRIKVRNLNPTKEALVNWANVNNFGSQQAGFTHFYATRARLTDDQGKNLSLHGGAEFKTLAPNHTLETTLTTNQVIDSATLTLSLPVGFSQFIQFQIPLDK